MSDILKCPFCQQELDYLAEDIYGGMYCPNCKKHDLFGNEKMWQELIRTRKALEIAVDALKEYADRDNWGMGFAPWLEDGFNDALYTEDGYKTAEKTLEQITALEQKE